MGIELTLTCHARKTVVRSAGFCLFAGAMVLMSALAVAQDVSRGPKAQQDQSVIGNIGRWFDAQIDYINSTFNDTRKRLESFGQEAGVAAKTTVNGARDAADVVARIPNTRVVLGHEKCRNAPNGAPDCVAAANTICKAKGFGSGKSVDMTTAEVCPPKVLLSGRTSGPECRNETFVSRVVCQ